MLNVLWIAFQPIPIITQTLKLGDNVATGGWLQGAADIVCSHDEISLSYCFQHEESCEGKAGRISYYTMGVVPEVHSRDITAYREEDFNRFKEIIEKVQPDIIHIYGTEKWFQRQFVLMANDLGLLEKTVVWIQGLVGFCAHCYTDGLSVRQFKKKTFWELIRGTNVEGIQKRLALNGQSEIRILKLLKNVFVRTEWDSACCKAINPNLTLHFCNETLRPAFFENKVWKKEKVKKHSIFMSQYGTPIKGYHQMLKALPIILKEFPDTVLYTTGADLLIPSDSLMRKLREPSYIKVLREEIKENRLEQHVRFLGTLQGEEMRDQYLASHVFVSASSIENSPNSVGEAMILGVPTVASDVGGVSSMMTHREEGLLYPFNEYAVLAEYVCRIFRDDTLAAEISQKARKRALDTHDKENNYRTLLKCYQQMINGLEKQDRE